MIKNKINRLNGKKVWFTLKGTMSLTFSESPCKKSEIPDLPLTDQRGQRTSCINL